MRLTVSQTVIWTGWFLSTAVMADNDRPDPAGTPTIVNVNVFVIDLNDVDDANQTISASMAVLYQWRDPRLADPQGEVRTMDLDKVWNPQVIILNAQRILESLPKVVEVQADGTVTYRQRYFGQFSNPLRLDDFPFDTQQFSLRFSSFGYSEKELQFGFDVPDGGSGMTEHPSVEDWTITEWEVRSQTYSSEESNISVAGFVFAFSGTRDVTFFYVKVFFPLILVIAMSWIVFWIDPVHIGPQISVAVTAMLTLIAYRFMLGNLLPRVAYLTRLDYFLLGSTIMVFLALVQVVAASRLAFLEKQNQARLLDKVSRYVFPTLFVVLIVVTLYR